MILPLVKRIQATVGGKHGERKRVKQISLRALRAIVWDDHREVVGILRWHQGKIEIVAKGTATNVVMTGVVLEESDWPFHTHLFFPNPSTLDWESVRYVSPQLIVGPPGTGGSILLPNILIHIDDDVRLPVSEKLLQIARQYPQQGRLVFNYHKLQRRKPWPLR